MVPSLGLTLYNLGRSRDPGPAPARPARPLGRLAWLHAPNADAARALFALARRLTEEDGLAILMTCADDLAARDGIMIQRPPPENPFDSKAFLTHWQPDIAVFAEGELRPTLLHETAQRKIPLVLVDGRSPSLLREREGWYPGLIRSALVGFAHIGAVDEASARAFRKAGAALSAVAVTGRMEEDSAAMPCLEAERAALARLFAARPVWFATNLPQEEETAVIAAHRMALQQAHRLLLILMPEDPARAEPLAHQIEAAEGWAVALRSLDQEPDPETEVFIVDNPAEYGLWYRLSPVCFLGGSLGGAGSGRDPMEAAALGSAILHGPSVGRYGAIFGRLGAARAARAVSSAADLGEALGDVLAPDRSARMAQAAWAVATDGAEVTEKAVTVIRRLMKGAA